MTASTIALQTDEPATMSGEQHSGDVSAPVGYWRVIGFHGTFTAWGLECVRQILLSAGYATHVTSLDHASSDLDDPSVKDRPSVEDGLIKVRVLFGHGPVVVRAGDVPLGTTVFLDAPARPFHELLSSGCDPVVAARVLTATLAPLAEILREDGTLLVLRTVEMDLVATQSAIASHMSGILARPPSSTPACPPIDVSAPVPVLVGQSLALLRQAIIPLANYVVSAARDPIVWPLACFYAGDYLSEQAAPFIEVVGKARIIYYGPYFYLPRGRWRADVQLIVSANMRDKKLAVDVYADGALARHEFKPSQGGLLQVSLQFSVEQADQRIEVRIELLEGTIEGHLGLIQVRLHPIES
jgi:hypothetical protein